MGTNALDRAIEAVESLPNLIKVVQGSKVDRVFRVPPLESRVLELDKGPDSEEWQLIKKLIYLQAPLKDKGTEPVPVGTTRDWTLLPEQVPVVDLGEVNEDVKYNKTTRERLAIERAHNDRFKRGPGRPKKEDK